MAGTSMRSILAKIDPRPANDAPRQTLELTLDDLEATLENARHRVGRAQRELEERLAEFHEAEKAFVERINPQLTHHVIVARGQEEETGE